MYEKRILDLYRVQSGEKINLDEVDTEYGFLTRLQEFKKSTVKERLEERLAQNIKDLAEMQELFYASDTYSLLLIFQGMDAAGKDGIIKHVMSGVNPQGCQVYSFKQPSAVELDHDFLWRCALCLPERGRIGIFNRSHYEEVLVVKVHPKILNNQRLPDCNPDEAFWQQRYESIRSYEKHLAKNGTIILKFYLHLSKQEQKKRFLDRLDNPEKYWKFSTSDLAERAYWKDYQKAFEDTLRDTSTDYAPWYIVPADHKWFARALVADIIVSTIRSLDLKYPVISDEQLKAMKEAKKTLEEER
ncbi:MAG: polyphosphate kinase 2 family protein [Bacteroidales bacterium]|nr:polyphosphate kinase 2 family protein [Lentimicrobiaceae bacterium]MDD5696028.1 polyphosphate kinase 2 family protein [Bacteroidales bacterium]